MDGQGRVELRPLLRLRGRAPASAGSHALRLEAAGGAVEVPFEPRRVADWPGGELRHFTVLAPDPGPLRALELRQGDRVLHRVEAVEARAMAAPDPRPELRESGGQLELRWDAAAFPQASVTRVGPEGRTVLGLWLEGGRALLSTAGLPPGGRFELSFAQGLGCVRLERPR
jgi:hypothetical protein